MRRDGTARRIHRRGWLLATALVATVVLAGCGVPRGAPRQMDPEMHMPGMSASPTPPPPSTAASAATSEPGPSAASQMICGTEILDTITGALALAAPPHTVDSWVDSQYSCTYHLAEGAFVVSVQESADAVSARSYFDTLQGTLASAQPIAGLANLGFPAYQTPDGLVVFLKDNMTLQVDSTSLTEKIGPHGVTRGAFSYEIASAILGCWTE